MQILLPVSQPDLWGVVGAGKKSYSLLQNQHLRGVQTGAEGSAHAGCALLSYGSACGCSPADSKLRQAGGPPMSSKSKLSLQLCSLKSRSKPSVKAQAQAWMTEANRVKMKRISQECHQVQMSMLRRTCADTCSCLRHPKPCKMKAITWPGPHRGPDEALQLTFTPISTICGAPTASA